MHKRPCPQQLCYDDIKNSSERHISHEDGKQLIVNWMNDDDAPATSAKLRLRCKLSGGRIEVPVRSVHCRTHLECMDLRNYLSCEAKNSATIDAPSSKKSERPLWACSVCGERARPDDLRVDDYFAHILQSVPDSVDEVLLHQDGSFKDVSRSEPEDPIEEVMIDDDKSFEPQQEHLHIEPSGPGRDVKELLKQSKAFQRTLQDDKSFRTKKDLREGMQLFLENCRERSAFTSRDERARLIARERAFSALCGRRGPRDSVAFHASTRPLSGRLFICLACAPAEGDPPRSGNSRSLQGTAFPHP